MFDIVSFFDYDMDGMPEMYLMMVGGTGNKEAFIYSYREGNFVESADDSVGDGNIDMYYEIYRNEDNQWIFLKKNIWTYGRGVDVCVSKYDLQTRETVILCYESVSMDGSGDESSSCKNGQGNEISEEEANHIVEEAIKGYTKINYEAKEAYIRGSSDIQKIVEEAFDAYCILE